MRLDRAPLVSDADPYLTLEPEDWRRLVALSECRCGERAAVDAAGLCAVCGRTRLWDRWIAAA